MAAAGKAAILIPATEVTTTNARIGMSSASKKSGVAPEEILAERLRVTALSRATVIGHLTGVENGHLGAISIQPATHPARAACLQLLACRMRARPTRDAQMAATVMKKLTEIESVIKWSMGDFNVIDQKMLNMIRRSADYMGVKIVEFAKPRQAVTRRDVLYNCELLKRQLNQQNAAFGETSMKCRSLVAAGDAESALRVAEDFKDNQRGSKYLQDLIEVDIDAIKKRTYG